MNSNANCDSLQMVGGVTLQHPLPTHYSPFNTNGRSQVVKRKKQKSLKKEQKMSNERMEMRRMDEGIESKGETEGGTNQDVDQHFQQQKREEEAEEDAQKKEKKERRKSKEESNEEEEEAKDCEKEDEKEKRSEADDFSSSAEEADEEIISIQNLHHQSTSRKHHLLQSFQEILYPDKFRSIKFNHHSVNQGVVSINGGQVNHVQHHQSSDYPMDTMKKKKSGLRKTIESGFRNLVLGKKKNKSSFERPILISQPINSSLISASESVTLKDEQQEQLRSKTTTICTIVNNTTDLRPTSLIDDNLISGAISQEVNLTNNKDNNEGVKRLISESSSSSTISSSNESCSKSTSSKSHSSTGNSSKTSSSTSKSKHVQDSGFSSCLEETTSTFKVPKGDKSEPKSENQRSKSQLSEQRSSESDSSAHLVLSLVKDVHGELGIYVSGVREDEIMKYYVSDLEPGSVAKRNGSIEVGDEVIAVNGHELRGLSLSKALELLKTDDQRVQLVISKIMIRDADGHDGDKKKMTTDCSVINNKKQTRNSSKIPRIVIQRQNSTPSLSYRDQDNVNWTPTGVPTSDKGRHKTLTRTKSVDKLLAPKDDGDDDEDKKRKTPKVEEVTFLKGPPHKPLGFSVIGPLSDGSGVVVKTIYDHGQCKESKLKSGDELIAINGTKLKGLTHQQVLNLFKAVKVGPIKINYVPKRSLINVPTTEL